MPSIEITNNSSVGVVIAFPVYDDNTLTASGAVDWAAGTLLGRITASGKLTAYASGAADGSEVPVAVLPEAVSFAGAGDKPGRPLIAGQLRRSKLIAHGVGAITDAEADALRSYGMIPLRTAQLAEADNQ